MSMLLSFCFNYKEVYEIFLPLLTANNWLMQETAGSPSTLECLSLLAEEKDFTDVSTFKRGKYYILL